MIKKLEFIFNQFDVASNFSSYLELNSGHINDTFLIKTTQKPYYILQKINGQVFKEAEALILNKVIISNHLQDKLSDFSEEYIKGNSLCFVATKENRYYYKDTDKTFWNMSVFIENSITYHKAPNKNIAFEAGKATGNFLALTADVNIESLTVILPEFHSVKMRYSQFLEALKNTSESRLKKAKNLIDFTNVQVDKMMVLDAAIHQQKLPIRVTHNDTKISNILFLQDDTAICLIDTDTVMPGVIHFDYGDAIRTTCNTADEDESNLEEVQFHMEYFKSYTLGFCQQIKESCSAEEVRYLPMSTQILPFIMGLRFLTDYLNHDIYYKTTHPQHNFDRAANQFKLVKEIQDNFSEIEHYIQTVFTS